MEKPVLWTAIVTPLTTEGKIDFQSFENILRKQAQAHNGIVVLGSTGEGLAFNEAEKREIVTFAFKLNLGTPIMVGVNGFNLESTLEWLKFCESFEALHSFLMPVPLYAKPGTEGQIQWFRTLMDSVKHPCMLYNVPSRTGVKFSFEAFKNLANHPRFWALKEASGSIEDFKTFRGLAPHIEIYSGEDSLLPAFAYYGAKGLVSVMSNPWPIETNLFVKKCLNFDFEGLYPSWDIAAQSMFIASNPVPAKKLLHLKKWITTPILRAPLTHLEKCDSETLEQADSLIQNWYRLQTKREENLHA
ncbi:MAG: 4-hydroxy-tetrahydrodipicolinate synthase [Halobacteriovoraceae bacterium]|nr:4-hydroxy-tetrahydrodipicolinate synthase [Halobacteriovoraceae bacterium]MCB9093864.1 4-hydroxy-tetrahydrodipicolinate synthase [Halobacteriovoraceae bacterium]